MTLKYHLEEFIKDPLNPAKNFNLGLCYDIEGHTASAASFYLRCAEYSYDNDLSYESLLRLASCLGKQSRNRYRDWETDRKSTRLNSSHSAKSRMPSSA